MSSCESGGLELKGEEVGKKVHPIPVYCSGGFETKIKRTNRSVPLVQLSTTGPDL